MDFSVEDFITQHKDKISPKLKRQLDSDYVYLCKKLGARLANDTLGKRILSNEYGTAVDYKFAIAFKKWVNKKLEDYYSASKSVANESTVHCYIGNTEVL